MCGGCRAGQCIRFNEMDVELRPPYGPTPLLSPRLLPSASSVLPGAGDLASMTGGEIQGLDYIKKVLAKVPPVFPAPSPGPVHLQ